MQQAGHTTVRSRITTDNYRNFVCESQCLHLCKALVVVYLINFETNLPVSDKSCLTNDSTLFKFPPPCTWNVAQRSLHRISGDYCIPQGSILHTDIHSFPPTTLLLLGSQFCIFALKGVHCLTRATDLTKGCTNCIGHLHVVINVHSHKARRGFTPSVQCKISN